MAGHPRLDFPSVLALPEACRKANAAALAAAVTLAIPTAEPFTVALVGPVDGGKTALVRAMLGAEVAAARALEERPGPDTLAAVEYVASGRFRIMLGIGGSEVTPQRWIPADPDDPQALARPNLRRVRVETTIPLLREWGIRIIDHPSVTEAEELRGPGFHELWQKNTAIIYLLPARGWTDVDENALELLRERPLTVVENIRDRELLPSRSVLTLREATGLTCPVVVPIVAFRDVAGERVLGAWEHGVLRLCIALMRRAMLKSDLLGQVAVTAAKAQTAIRLDVAGRSTAVTTGAHTTGPVARLQALADLLSLERDLTTLAPLDTHLTELRRLIDDSRTVSDEVLRTSVRGLVVETLDRYNIEAASRRTAAPAAAGDPEPAAASAPAEPEETSFGRAYVRVRKDLLGILGNIVGAAAELALTEADQVSINSLTETVQHDRVELAMLGQFSSGKSSLINALLKVDINDNAPKLLPTAVRAETATVNRVEYADEPRINGVSWLPKVSLTFLSRTADPLRWRVHVDEIRAFRAWIDTGQVIDGKYRFDTVGEAQPGRRNWLGRAVRDDSPLQPFEILWQALGFAGPIPVRPFAYEPGDTRSPQLPNDRIAIAVEISGFQLPAQGWPDRPTLASAFEAVRSPQVALRVDTLHVGYPDPLLKHASIIDTPGTDAVIPHHRTVARQVIREKECPVIYCFFGVKPGSAEDTGNLTFLKRTGIDRSNLFRFFFVITQQGMIPPEDRDEVRAAITAKLAAIGVHPPRLYFTEVVTELNDDFRDLERDLGAFAARSHRPRLVSWIDQIRTIMRAVAQRHEDHLASAAETQAQKAARVARLQAEAAALATLTRDFERSTSWGRPWAKDRLKQGLRSEAADVDRIVSGLTDRDSFNGVGSRLDSAIDELNAYARKLVKQTCEATTGKLRSEISDRMPGRTVTARKLRDKAVYYPSASVRSAADRVQWRGGFKRFGQLFTGHSWNEDVQANRERIAGPWDSSSSTGLDSADDELTASLDHLAQELARLGQSIAAEIVQAQQADPPEVLEEVRRRLDRTHSWLFRFDALERDFIGGLDQ